MDSSYLTPEYIKPKVRYTENSFVQINRLLRGEIAATEAYKQVIKKVSNDPAYTRLNGILHDHEAAIIYWRKQINGHSEAIDDSSGPWGTIVDTFITTAKLFGLTAMLRALKEGEEHGLKKYKDLLLDNTISSDHKTYIRDIFIGLQQKHILSLESLIKMQ